MSVIVGADQNTTAVASLFGPAIEHRSCCHRHWRIYAEPADVSWPTDQVALEQLYEPVVDSFSRATADTVLAEPDHVWRLVDLLPPV
ncbi:hypothetical protein [Halocatena salina]|uniref:Uncharacterized protein n=1 Tax=Halocatena salina TaxID=2934340 RepID=A0A8U0A8B3_9EURY|nr:hypothetical protein [Halocatena salina]UPM44728.1 hypothetical protein MW046_17005 [Halocatena salina]